MSLARVDRKRPCPVNGSYHCFACAVGWIGLEAARKLPAFSKARASLRLVKEYPMKPVQSSTIKAIGYVPAFSKARASLRLVKEYPMKPVQSSTIKAIGYDAATFVLTIEFSNGGTYEYWDVPLDVFLAFEKAESLGKHLHQHIKGKYQFKKLEGSPEVKS